MYNSNSENSQIEDGNKAQTRKSSIVAGDEVVLNENSKDIDEKTTRARAIIVNSNKEVLMCYSNGRKHYEFPGGHLEFDENLILASRNLKNLVLILADEINVLDIVGTDVMVITEDALKFIEEVLK